MSHVSRGAPSEEVKQTELDTMIVRVREHLVDRGLPANPTTISEAADTCGLVAGPTIKALIISRLGDALQAAGVLQPLLETPGVTDVMVNGSDSVWVDDQSGLHRVDVSIGDEAAIRRLAQRLAGQAGRRLDEAEPFVDARLPDGTRLHAALGSIASPGTLISLRRPAAGSLTLRNLGDLGTYNRVGEQLLREVIDARLSFLITGGTGSGKTTLLRAMLRSVHPRSRVLIVEECAELAVQHPHAVSLEARPPNAEGSGRLSLAILVRQAMRMRPDRIVVGEVRGPEVKDLLAAMNTGHEGCAGTVHANSAETVPERLQALGSGATMTSAAVVAQTAAGVDLILHMKNSPGSGRRLMGIWGIEKAGAESLQVTCVWDLSGKRARLRRPDSWLARRLSSSQHSSQTVRSTEIART